MKEAMKDKLAALSHETLVAFIEQLYGHDDDVDQRIESLVLRNDPHALCKALKKRVQTIKRGRRFIDYSESFSYARHLEDLLDDVEQLLLPQSAERAFQVIDAFVRTSRHSFERADDSSGAIGDAYRRGVALWLRVASQWQDSGEDWQDRVSQLYAENDYGVYDDLLSNADILLSEAQLRQLAWRYENEARQAIRNPPAEERSYDAKAASGCIALGMVATALRDIALYERATLLRSPVPNGLQKERLARFCLDMEAPEAALKWLESPWEERFESRRLHLLDEAYLQLNDTEKLTDVRRTYYRLTPGFDALSALVAVVPEREKAGLMEQAVSDAENLVDPCEAATMLLKLACEERAEQLLVRRYSELHQAYYASLLALAKSFEKVNKPLAASICYRSLFDDLLQQGYSKAYRHGARYLRKLQGLDGEIRDYQGLPDASGYEKLLREHHGRKRSFWSLVDE